MKNNLKKYARYYINSKKHGWYGVIRTGYQDEEGNIYIKLNGCYFNKEELKKDGMEVIWVESFK